MSTKIEWTDETWNPVTGCTKVSKGCKNCYAEKIYERFNGRGSFKKVICHQDRLTIPLKWKRPRMVFVNSMSDLFHEKVPFPFIDAVFRVMSDIDQHTYQVLTKRPKRMVEFFNWKKAQFGIPWQPKGNVWFGASIEDQKSANERIPWLLQVPGIIFLSAEPLLGPIDFNKMPWPRIEKRSVNGRVTIGKLQYIDWVICGGESGHKARPMHPEWVRSIRKQCISADVPFFFKQWGQWKPYECGDEAIHNIGTFVNKDREWNDNPVGTFIPDILGINWGTPMAKTSKKAAGRRLDGHEWNDMPTPYPHYKKINHETSHN